MCENSLSIKYSSEYRAIQSQVTLYKVLYELRDLCNTWQHQGDGVKGEHAGLLAGGVGSSPTEPV